MAPQPPGRQAASQPRVKFLHHMSSRRNGQKKEKEEEQEQEQAKKNTELSNPNDPQRVPYPIIQLFGNLKPQVLKFLSPPQWIFLLCFALLHV